MRLESKRFVIRNEKQKVIDGQNAVFLTTGIVTECAILNPASSWVQGGGQTGPPVKRIRLRPFAIEYERTVAFFGNFLDVDKSNCFGGPIYGNGLSFSTRKDTVRKGVCIFLSPFEHVYILLVSFDRRFG